MSSEVIWPALLLGPQCLVVARCVCLKLRLIRVYDLAATVLALYHVRTC